MTRAELVDWVGGLRPHDLSVAVAVVELVRHADQGGSAERGVWLASVRESYAALEQRESHGFRMASADIDPTAAYIGERVFGRLEAAEIAHREPPHEGWERVQIDPALWDEVRSEGRLVAEELHGLVRVLQERATSGSAAVGEATDTREGSHLRAEGLVKIYRKRKVVDDVAIAVSQGRPSGCWDPMGQEKRPPST